MLCIPPDRFTAEFVSWTPWSLAHRTFWNFSPGSLVAGPEIVFAVAGANTQKTPEILCSFRHIPTILTTLVFLSLAIVPFWDLEHLVRGFLLESYFPQGSEAGQEGDQTHFTGSVLSCVRYRILHEGQHFGQSSPVEAYHNLSMCNCISWTACSITRQPPHWKVLRQEDGPKSLHFQDIRCLIHTVPLQFAHFVPSMFVVVLNCWCVASIVSYPFVSLSVHKSSLSSFGQGEHRRFALVAETKRARGTASK